MNSIAHKGRPYYSKAHSLKTLDDEVFTIMMDANAMRPSPQALITLQHVHGAASRVNPTATAFSLREEHYAFQLMASWDGEEAGAADAHIGWTRALWKAVEPFATGENYVNYLEDEGEARAQASYGPNYERLVRVKNTYDPTNFFHLNQNIKPIV